MLKRIFFFFLKVFIAAFYYNYELFIQLLPQLKPQITIEWLFQEILDLYKHLKGIHNRKMFLYFMCIVLTFNYDNVPSIIKNHPNFVFINYLFTFFFCHIITKIILILDY